MSCLSALWHAHKQRHSLHSKPTLQARPKSVPTQQNQRHLVSWKQVPGRRAPQCRTAGSALWASPCVPPALRLQRCHHRRARPQRAPRGRTAVGSSRCSGAPARGAHGVRHARRAECLASRTLARARAAPCPGAAAACADWSQCNGCWTPASRSLLRLCPIPWQPVRALLAYHAQSRAGLPPKGKIRPMTRATLALPKAATADATDRLREDCTPSNMVRRAYAQTPCP